MNTPSKISTIIIGLMVVLFVLVSAGNFLTNTLDAANEAIGNNSNITKSDFLGFYNESDSDDYWDQTTGVSSSMGSALQQTNQSGIGRLVEGWDFLVNAWRVIVNIFTLGSTTTHIINDMGDNLPIPPVLIFMIISMIGIVITITILNSMRKYKN